jgi:hypothetical protein
MSSIKRWSDEDLIAAIPVSKTYADVIRILGLSEKSAGNWATVQKHIKRLGLDTSHFDRYHGIRTSGLIPKKPLSEIMVQESTYSTHSLAKRLVSEGIRDQKCTRCGLTEWQGVPVPLELDHINGVPNDHRDHNLRFLCPNCHALTPTWRGRGRKKTVLCECGRPKFKTSSRCQECSNFAWPSVDRLIQMRETMSLAKIGKQLGVAGQSVGRYIRNNQ